MNVPQRPLVHVGALAGTAPQVATTATSVSFTVTFAGSAQLAVGLLVSHFVSCTNRIPLTVTVRLTVVVCVTPPPLAVIVIV